MRGFDTHENFLGIYNVDNMKADTLVTVIKKSFDYIKRKKFRTDNFRVKYFQGK